MKTYSDSYVERFAVMHIEFRKEIRALVASGKGVNSPEFKALKARFAIMRKGLANDLH